MKYGLLILIGLIILSCMSAKSNAQENSTVDIVAQSVQSSNGAPACDANACPMPACPAGMIQIKGNFCPNLEEVCLRWLDKPVCSKTDPITKQCLVMNAPMRCAEFKKPTVCHSKTVPMNFCIDKFEYPNQEGVKPKLRNTWYEAKSQCEAQGKRLCVDNEWTQACRGDENLPYPYGYERDATACLIDLPWQDPSTHSFEELDKTVPAGTMPRCVSPYGVFDMTGNGDEWCKSSGGTPYQSVLKGGHPHGVRNRCTPRTDGHNEYFTFYDTGFRCCKDSL